MIRIKFASIFLFLIILGLPLFAEDNKPSWLNKKILKLQNLNDKDATSSELNTNYIVSTIDLNDLAEENLTLPYYYWSWSNVEDLTKKIGNLDINPKPQIRELVLSILTSEMPNDIKIAKEANLYITRLNKLLEIGNYEEAQRFIKNNDPDLRISYHQQFKLNILKGNDTLACAQFKIESSENTSLTQKIYCLDYEGKKSEAKIIYETAKTLNRISDHESLILEILLYSKEIDETNLTKNINNLSILDYVILQKNGIKIENKLIPIPLLYYNLSQISTLEKRLFTLEKLAGLGIVTNKKLFVIYLEEDNVYNAALLKRKKCINELEAALLIKKTVHIREKLTKCLLIFEKIGLSSQFSKYYREAIKNEVNDGWETPTSIKMRLLSKDYSSLGNELSENSNFSSAQSIAKNNFDKLNDLNANEQNIIDAFRNPKFNVQIAAMIDQGKIGEVIISSIKLLESGNSTDFYNGLVALIQAGLIETAKDIAIRTILKS